MWNHELFSQTYIPSVGHLYKQSDAKQPGISCRESASYFRFAKKPPTYQEVETNA